MGYHIIKNGNKVTYGLIEFIADTETDVTKIPVLLLSPGSKCFVIETSSTYMLNTSKAWKKIANSGGGTGTGSAEIIALENKVDKLSNNVLYKPSVE